MSPSIGAGVFGAWTAHHLPQAGHRVTLIDAWGPAHRRSSSGGESRLTRGAYGKDAIYTRMAFDSLPQWKALSAIAGLPIFHQCGVLFFFPTEEPYVQRQHRGARGSSACPTEVLDQAEMARRFPMIDFDGISIGLFEPQFGALMARRSVQTLVDRFVRAGGTYRARRCARAAAATARRCTQIALSIGERIAADRFVFALGPWLPKLFPDVIGARILATRQEIFFFAPPAGDRRFLPGAMPGWADFNAATCSTAFPTSKAAASSSPTTCTASRSIPTRRTGARPRPRSPRSSPSATAASRCSRGAPLTEARGLPV